MIDIQADLPAQLSGKGPPVVRRNHPSGRRHGHLRTHVSRPVRARESGNLLGEGWHPEGLIEEPTALVPVPERIPGWAVHKAEGNPSLGHGLSLSSVSESFQESVVSRLGELGFIRTFWPTPFHTSATPPPIRIFMEVTRMSIHGRLCRRHFHSCIVYDAKNSQSKSSLFIQRF
ncbi:hypothetical protein PO909_026673 [Leuciscus waleckii]